MVGLAAKRNVALHLEQTLGVSERSTCRVLSLKPPGANDAVQAQKKKPSLLNVSVSCRRSARFGYRKIHWRLKDENVRVGRERVRIIRKCEGLQVIRKQRRRRALGTSTVEVTKAEYPGHVWSYDFISDQSINGRTLKFLTITDEFTRRGQRIHCGRSVTSGDVIRILDDLFMLNGAPAYIRSDNGPEFIATALQKWLKERQTGIIYIDPGCLWQNPYNESFNSVFRDGASTVGCLPASGKRNSLPTPGYTNTIMSGRTDRSVV
ncbi:MAG TPA: transposase [Gammaproteobacteria bacterium]|nr:transposase [Gammaproteobacteria bacterium]